MTEDDPEATPVEVGIIQTHSRPNGSIRIYTDLGLYPRQNNFESVSDSPVSGDGSNICAVEGSRDTKHEAAS